MNPTLTFKQLTMLQDMERTELVTFMNFLPCFVCLNAGSSLKVRVGVNALDAYEKEIASEAE